MTFRMTFRTAAVTTALIILAMLAAAIWVSGQVPADQMVTTQWDQHGNPGRETPASVAVFLMVGAAAFAWIVCWLVPRIDPRRENIARSGHAYGTIWVGVTLVMAVGHAAILSATLGSPLPVERIIPASVGLLFMAIGNVMGKLRPNFMAGIRTPWTLSDDHVWDKTHRFGGKVMVAAGFAILTAGLMTGGDTFVAIMLTAITGMVTLPVAYSYLLWRRRRT